jgi:hypothetical protein
LGRPIFSKLKKNWLASFVTNVLGPMMAQSIWLVCLEFLGQILFFVSFQN